MIRLFSILVLFLIAGMLGYLLIKSHGALLIKWKHTIEEYEATDGEMFQDETKLKNFANLIGYTLIPLAADLFILGMAYVIIKEVVL